MGPPLSPFSQDSNIIPPYNFWLLNDENVLPPWEINFSKAVIIFLKCQDPNKNVFYFKFNVTSETQNRGNVSNTEK